jgi:hypothetical protein
MNKAQNNLLAQSYQSAWYAYSGQPIAVSTDDHGLFRVRFNESNTIRLPEWRSTLRVGELLVSLSHITENLALKREEQGSLTYTRV